MTAEPGRVAAFLRAVLRDSWPSLVAILCATYVDDVRPRGSCGTHPADIAGPLFLGSLCLCAAVIYTTLRRIARRRTAVTAVSTAINIYAVSVSLFLALPYA